MDLIPSITPKSDQLNADDLIPGPRTLHITKVEVRGSGEQPVSVFFVGDQGKPWKPCKSMLRLLVSAWGASSSDYIGRSVTVTLDPSVKWAGKPIGGIRITHLSDIGAELTVALTDQKGSRKPYTVKPLDPELFTAELETLKSATTLVELRSAWEVLPLSAKGALKPKLETLKSVLQ